MQTKQWRLNMIDIEKLNYGAVYSFEPTFMKHIVEEDKTVQHADEESVTYDLDRVDTKWSGVLVILVFFLMLGLVISLTTSISKDSVFKLTGANISHIVRHNFQ
jgi:Fe2+ transport system protein B